MANPKVTKACVICEIEFPVYPSTVMNRTCCSRKCSRINKISQQETRFWRRVVKTDGCWLWTGGLHDPKGYGAASWNNRPDKTHRISWKIHFGPIPSEMCVLHHCDNPPCVNPDHLFLGTNEDNNADRDTKGRTSRGVTRPGALLNDERVRAAREIYKAGDASCSRLGHMFGVAEKTMWLAITGRTWKHVL